MGNKLCTGEKLGGKVFTGNKLGSKVFTGKYIRGKHISFVTKHIVLHTKTKTKQHEHVVDIDIDIDPTFVCDLCDAKSHLENSFNIKGCAHFYCRECVVQYVASNLQNNVTSAVMCPVQGCTGALDPDYCRPILPDDVFDGWGNALCESALADESDDIDSTFVCDFCVEPVDLKDSFNIKGCSHFYCQDCIVKFVASKLDDNVSSITCPAQGCTGTLELDYCRPILPTDLFDRWGKAICESVVIGPQKKYLYCPFVGCSALLIHEGPEDTNQAPCPHCKREFCAKCKVPWHTEFNCSMFQKLRDKGEDEMLEELAKNKNWRRCPRCSYYVERIDGCSYMKCRCGFAFCYSCGIQAVEHTRYCQSCKK